MSWRAWRSAIVIVAIEVGIGVIIFWAVTR